MPIPPRFQQSYWDRKRNQVFKVSEMRALTYGSIVVDMVGQKGEFQQFSIDFFKNLISRGELVSVKVTKPQMVA